MGTFCFGRAVYNIMPCHVLFPTYYTSFVKVALKFSSLMRGVLGKLIDEGITCNVNTIWTLPNSFNATSLIKHDHLGTCAGNVATEF